MKIVLGIILLALTPLGFASQQEGTIVNVLIRASDGLTYVTMTGNRTGVRPGCATHGYWIIKQEDSEVGKRQYSALLAAKFAGSTVAIVGAETCTRWGDGEDINSVVVKD